MPQDDAQFSLTADDVYSRQKALFDQYRQYLFGGCTGSGNRAVRSGARRGGGRTGVHSHDEDCVPMVSRA